MLQSLSESSNKLVEIPDRLTTCVGIATHKSWGFVNIHFVAIRPNMIELLSSPTTSQWLTILSMYGWIWIIPLIERLKPLKHQSFIRKGMVNDVIHTYHRLHLHSMINIVFVTWMLTYLRENGTQSLPYQGVLADAHWAWNMFALLLMSHVTFYICLLYTSPSPRD